MDQESKENINKEKKKHSRLLAITIILVAVVVSLGGYLVKRECDFKNTLESQYNRSFYELVGYVENVETSLAKSMVTNSSEYSTQNLVNLWREANLAQDALSQIPIEVNLLEDANKFLNQVSDYSYSLSRMCIYDKDLSEEQMNNISTLYNHSKTLKEELNSMSSEINAGDFSWDKVTKNGNRIFSNSEEENNIDLVTNVNNDLQNYSGLIYDGAFSDHITQIEPLGLTGDDISEEQAKEKIYTFIEQSTVREITSNGLTGEKIQCYSFNVLLNDAKEEENYMYIDITKKGGHLFFMAYNRQYAEPTIDIETAKQKGKEYLDKIGYANMQETYHMNEDGAVVVNYANMQNDAIMYTDLIKVKIALDNGEIMGVEAKGYLYNNHDRADESPVISVNQAREKIGTNVTIESERLCVIPTDWKTEVMCYEFKGKVEDKTFLIYINTENGQEEEIFIVIDDESGVLTI